MDVWETEPGDATPAWAWCERHPEAVEWAARLLAALVALVLALVVWWLVRSIGYGMEFPPV